MPFTPAVASLLAGLMFTALLVYLLLDSVGGKRGVPVWLIIILSVVNVAFTGILVLVVATDTALTGSDGAALYAACFGVILLFLAGIVVDARSKRKS
jgi:hypothetical protein